MLQRLSRERSTGVLTVRGREGWKVLELQAGSISVVSQASGKRLRLGEILLARGKISEELLAEALETNRASGVPLGEVLAQDRHVSRSDVQEIVRFQVEEEIYDLFTWRGAECTFQANTSLGEQVEDYPAAAKLSVDPQKVFVEAARRIPLWQRIEGSIPSNHAIYRLTERGESMHRTATRGGRKLLDLVNEGYCVGMIVRKAMVGRFAIWKALADLVEAQAVAVIPDAEIAELCGRWEAEGKFEQALGACLRMEETAKDPQKLAEIEARTRTLRQRIEETERRKFAEASAGLTLPKKSRYRAIALLSVLVVLVLALFFAPEFLSGGSGRGRGRFEKVMRTAGKLKGDRKKDEETLEDCLRMMKTMRDAQKLSEFKARAEGLRDEIAEKAEEAILLWELFLAREPEETIKDLATSAKDIAEREYFEDLVDAEISRARELEEGETIGDAVGVYEDVMRRYSRTRIATRTVDVADLLRTAEAKQAKHIALLSREELASKFEAAQRFIREKRYTEAYRVLQGIKKSPHAGAELGLKVQKEEQAIAKAEGEALALVNAARAREAADDLDGALTLYDECRSRLGNTRSGPIAAKRHRELVIDKDRAQTLYKEALRHYAKGEFTDAHGNLKMAARIKGFKVARLARQRLDEMKTAHKRAVELLASAERLRNEGELDESFEKQVELLKRFPYTAAARSVTLEVSIETFPVGATVVKNDKDLGPAPIPAARFLPIESGVLVISKRGFATLEHRYNKVRTRVLRFYLKKKAAFRKGLGQPVRARPVGLKASDGRAKGAFFVHAGATLAAFRSDRGELLWQVRAGPAPSVRIHPSVLDKTVLVASGKALRAFSTSGELSYEIALSSPAVTSPAAVRLKLVANRAFAIVGCQDGSVVSIDLVSREVRWTARVVPPIRFDPAVGEKAVFVPSSDATIAAFDTRSGRRLWVANVAGEVACDLALDPEAQLVGALSSVGEVLVLGASNGMVRTRAALDGVRGGGIAIADRVAYVGGDDGKLRAVDTGTGATIWTLPVGGAVRATPIVRGGEVYVGTEKGNLICVDRRAGREEWRFPADSPVTAGATIVGGMLVFGTHDGEVFGLEVGKK